MPEMFFSQRQSPTTKKSLRPLLLVKHGQACPGMSRLRPDKDVFGSPEGYSRIKNSLNETRVFFVKIQVTQIYFKLVEILNP